MPTTLQINLSPGDYLHAKFIIHHQLNALADQVDEVLLIIDTKISKGRFATGWEEHKNKLYSLLNQIQELYNVTVLEVDYAFDQKKDISKFFFRKGIIPDKDYRGGPSYAYYYGLYKAKYDYVFHLDSDMFLGGGSKSWVKEAENCFIKHPSCLVVSPLPGPPHPQEKLFSQHIKKKISAEKYSFELKGMSTRIFLIDRSKFLTHKLAFKRPAIKNSVKALIDGNTASELPEKLFANYIEKNNLKRIDFLGTGKGLWSLHPPYRTAEFYKKLPEFIQKVEWNDLPKVQQGYYNIVDEITDWSEARQNLRKNRWWKRLLKYKTLILKLYVA